MNEEQIEEAERILSYYSCHGMNSWVEADMIKLLSSMLPKWSAWASASAEDES